MPGHRARSCSRRWATPAKDVAAFYDDLLPDWTREDIGLAESL